MRWIDRGPEPAQVREYARKYTQGWVKYFQDDVQPRPADFFWTRFRWQLGERSSSMCWYCEQRCSPAMDVGSQSETLDHFKPLSSFPELAYDWSNWVYSCHRCNVENKQGKWPEHGYVDPAADNERERPETYLDYDIKTHEVTPRRNLTGDDLQRALNTIDDLGLNRRDVIVLRQNWIQSLINDVRGLPIEDRCALAEHFARHAGEFLGTTRMVLKQMHEAGEIPQSPSP